MSAGSTAVVDRVGENTRSAVRTIAFALFTLSGVLSFVLASYVSYSLAYPTHDALVLKPETIKYEHETGRPWHDRDSKPPPNAIPSTAQRILQDQLTSNLVILLSLSSMAELVLASGLVRHGSRIVGAIFVVLCGIFFLMLRNADPRTGDLIDAHVTRFSLVWTVYSSVTATLFFALEPVNCAIARMINALAIDADARTEVFRAGPRDESAGGEQGRQRRRRSTLKPLAKLLWNSLEPRQQQSLIIFTCFFILSFLVFAASLPFSAYTAAIILVVMMGMGLVASGLLSEIILDWRPKDGEGGMTIKGAGNGEVRNEQARSRANEPNGTAQESGQAPGT